MQMTIIPPELLKDEDQNHEEDHFKVFWNTAVDPCTFGFNFICCCDR